MIPFLIFIPILLVIVTIVISLALILSLKTKRDREKASPFECGFDSNSSSRLPFSIRFFLITIIFLIFDVEIVILLPAIHRVNQALLEQWILVFITFVVILFIGLIHEWKQGALNWTF